MGGDAWRVIVRRGGDAWRVKPAGRGTKWLPGGDPWRVVKTQKALGRSDKCVFLASLYIRVSLSEFFLEQNCYIEAAAAASDALSF